MPADITIYHNPRCSKSRKTLELIREHGIEPRIVEYLQDMPDKAALLELAETLSVGVADIVRPGDADTDGGRPPEGNDAALADWLHRHPRRLQRPIVVNEKRREAAIGRPPENVLNLLKD